MMKDDSKNVWKDFFRPAIFNNLFSTYAMETDMYLEGNKYHIDINCPGLKKEEIKISYEDGYLQVKVETKQEKKECNECGDYFYKERSTGSTKRNYYIGDADKDTIKACYKDGVLKITLDKKKEEINSSTYIKIE